MAQILCVYSLYDEIEDINYNIGDFISVALDDGREYTDVFITGVGADYIEINIGGTDRQRIYSYEIERVS